MGIHESRSPRDLVGSVTRPLKELKGFQKITKRKRDSEISIEDLKFYNSI
jgi:beta-glucosidase